MRSLILLFLLSVIEARAQIQLEPIEISDVTPPSAFSERSGSWPSYEVQQDELIPGTRPISDSLNTIPGLQGRDQGSPTLSIRGSGQADRVLKLYEGIPLNFGDGLGASNLFIPEETIGSLRLLKGPSSVFYGPSAMAGALDHRSRLFERKALRLSVSDDSGLLGRRSVFLATPFKPDSQLTLFAENAPGRFAYDSPLSGGRRESNSLETLRTTFNAKYDLGTTSVRPLLLLARQTGETPGALNFPSSSKFRLHGTLAGIESKTQLDQSNKISFLFSDLRFWRSDEDSFGSSSYTNARTRLAADWGTRLFNDIELKTFTDLKTETLAATYLGDSKFTENSAELGQSADVPLTDSLALQPAYRYLADTGTFVKALGLHHSTDRSVSWLTYSEGFRAPSLSDRFANFPNFRANPSLKPETSRGLELGSRFEQGRRYGGFLEGILIGGTVHATEFDQLFESAPGGGAGVTTKINSGRAQTSGIEAEAGYGYRVWTISLAHSYLEAKNITTGERLRLAPRHQTTVSLSNAIGPAVIELKETIWSPYIDKDLANVTHELSGWQTTDLNIRTLGMTDWEIRGGILNLFDRSRELTYGYPEEQRRFYLSALRFF